MGKKKEETQVVEINNVQDPDKKFNEMLDKAIEAQNPFKVLELQDIEEGLFLRDLNQSLKMLQSRFICLAKQYQAPCKAHLIAKISLVFDPEASAYSLEASFKWIEPPPPPITAILEESTKIYNGHPGFAIQKSGTVHGEHPRQGKLFTQSGEEVDQESGEIRENKG